MIVMAVALKRGGRARVCALRCHRRCGPYARDYDAVSGIVTNLLPWAFVFCAIMSPSAACSVSMEGRSAWLMATAPLPVRTVLGAKLAANALARGGVACGERPRALGHGADRRARSGQACWSRALARSTPRLTSALGSMRAAPTTAGPRRPRLSSEASPSHWWLSWGSCLRPWRAHRLWVSPPRGRGSGARLEPRAGRRRGLAGQLILYVYLFAVDALAAELPPAACDQSLLAGHGSLIAPPRRERN